MRRIEVSRRVQTEYLKALQTDILAQKGISLNQDDLMMQWNYVVPGQTMKNSHRGVHKGFIRNKFYFITEINLGDSVFEPKKTHKSLNGPIILRIHDQILADFKTQSTYLKLKTFNLLNSI